MLTICSKISHITKGDILQRNWLQGDETYDKRIWDICLTGLLLSVFCEMQKLWESYLFQSIPNLSYISQIEQKP